VLHTEFDGGAAWRWSVAMATTRSGRIAPRERRALVLVDPPFEDQGEFEAILAALDEGLRRFRAGCMPFVPGD